MNDELYHYGVKGMRWGVRKRDYASEQLSTNARHILRYKTKLKKTNNSKKIKNYKEKIKYLEDDSKFIKKNRDKYNEIYDKFEIQKRRDRVTRFLSSLATTAALGASTAYLTPIAIAKGAKYLSDNPEVRSKILKVLNSAVLKEAEALGIDTSNLPIDQVDQMLINSMSYSATHKNS